MSRGVLDTLERRVGTLYGKGQRAVERLVTERRYLFPPEASREIPLAEVGFAAEGRSSYAPSPWPVLRRVLPPHEVTLDDVFVDFGCGMGRVLVEAARYPFGRVIGVEVVPDFARVARDVVERNRRRLRCPQVEVVVADALEYGIPDDLTVAYFANPFAPSLLDDVVARLVGSVDRRARRLRIVHLAPPGVPGLDRHPRVRLVRHGRRAIRRWAAADYLTLYEVTGVPSSGE